MADKPASIAHGDACYLPNYLSEAEATALYRWLRAHVRYSAEEICLFGRRLEVPRRVAWFGEPERCYRYSGLDHRASGWPRRLLPLVARISAELGERPNFVLLNLYRDGLDHMGWHTDDELMQGDAIASLSLGATRRFLMRRESRGISTRLDLEHGSLLLMNRRLHHCLPRARNVRDERINLTFRVL